MNMVPSCRKMRVAHTATCPLAEALPQPVETAVRGTLAPSPRFTIAMVSDQKPAVNEAIDSDRGKDKAPAPTFSGEPERELEHKLKSNPEDQDAKVDVGSDESMDASDPPAATQPGQSDDPVPSSGFPE